MQQSATLLWVEAIIHLDRSKLVKEAATVSYWYFDIFPACVRRPVFKPSKQSKLCRIGRALLYHWPEELWPELPQSLTILYELASHSELQVRQVISECKGKWNCEDVQVKCLKLRPEYQPCSNPCDSDAIVEHILRQNGLAKSRGRRGVLGGGALTY